MSHVTHPQWRDQVESTRYPFSDISNLTDQDGNTIPSGTFLDASLFPVGNAGIMYLSRIAVQQDQATIWVGTPELPLLCYGEVDLVDLPASIQLVDTYDRPAGILVSEPLRLAALQGWTQGDHNFSAASSEFVARVCIPRPEIGLQGILLDDGSLMTGDVWIVGDDGVVVRKETMSAVVDGDTVTKDVIRVDIVGDALFRRRLCSDSSLFATPRFLTDITFRYDCGDHTVIPDAFGNVNIFVGESWSADSVLRIINQSTRGITIEAVGQTR